jgi:uncharacterized protein (DUF362 family)
MRPAERSSRRRFLRDTSLALGGAALSSASLRLATAAEPAPDLVVAHGDDARANVRKAVELLGGMKQFVSRGDVVVVKPNIGWDRTAAKAANTNPDVVAAVVEMALEAGADKVKVFDHSVHNARATYQRSGIADAAEKAGAEVKFVDERFFKTVKIGGQYLKEWPVYMEAAPGECDCLINVPIAKQHSTSGLTMALKNFMGVIGGERGAWHPKLAVYLPEFAHYIKPKLTILDAYRILVRNGPTGGSSRDVEVPRKCIAGVDQVAVDAYGTRLFKKTPTQMGWLVKAKEMGIGETDMSKLTIKDIEVA